MILFAEISGQEWIVITTIVCGTVSGIFASFFGFLGAKYGAKKAVEANTDITIAAANRADVAAKHAEVAAGVGVQTRDILVGAAKNAKVAKDKAEINEKRIDALEEGSGLVRRKDHFKGDEK